MAFPFNNEWRRYGRTLLMGVATLILLRLGLSWWQGSLTGNDMAADGIILPVVFLFSGLMATVLGIVACRTGRAGLEIQDRRRAAAAFRAPGERNGVLGPFEEVPMRLTTPSKMKKRR